MLGGIVLGGAPLAGMSGGSSPYGARAILGTRRPSASATPGARGPLTAVPGLRLAPAAVPGTRGSGGA